LHNWRGLTCTIGGTILAQLEAPVKIPSATDGICSSGAEGADADRLADRTGPPHRLVGLVQEGFGVAAVLGAGDDAG